MNVTTTRKASRIGEAQSERKLSLNRSRVDNKGFRGLNSEVYYSVYRAALSAAVTLSQDVKYVTEFHSERASTETIAFRESLTDKIIEIANVIVDNE